MNTSATASAAAREAGTRCEATGEQHQGGAHGRVRGRSRRHLEERVPLAVREHEAVGHQPGQHHPVLILRQEEIPDAQLARRRPESAGGGRPRPTRPCTGRRFRGRE